MTNYEFYKEEIEMRLREGMSFKLTKRGVITECNDYNCAECVFSRFNNPDTKHISCGDRKMLWAVQKHVEKPKLTKKEKQFVDLMGEGLYLARDQRDQMLYLFERKPYKAFAEDDAWTTSGKWIPVDMFNGLEFKFIKWEDKEPWNVAMLSELEAEE